MDRRVERSRDLAGRTDPVGVLSDFSRRVRDGASMSALAGDAGKAAADLYGVPGALVLEIRDGELVPVGVQGFGGPVHAVFVDPMRPDEGVRLSARMTPGAGVVRESSLAVLITVRGRPWGMIAVFAPNDAPTSTANIYGLEVIAQLLATAIEARLAHEEIEHLSLHDPLTGLPGLAVLVDRLDEAIRRRRPERMLIAVVCIEIDQMVQINSTFGHHGGDRVIVELGARLRRTIRPVDTLARYGGARFMVLCEGLSSEAQLSEEADRLLAALRGAVRIGDHDLIVSASVGATTARPGASTDELLREADWAVQHAKERGGAQFVSYDAFSDRSPARRLELETELRRALSARQFRVHYQPVVRLDDDAVIGAEALIRWQHAQRGLLSPAEFMTIAEDSGLILPIGEWVLNTACHQACRWGQRAFDSSQPAPTVAVNLSGRQISEPYLLDRIRAALETANLPAEQLTLEITETVVMADAGKAAHVLGLLKDLGVSLAIDDFGTGYSSLSYLKHFPVDILKIDRSFVAGLGTDPDDGIIVGAVIRLADRLGIQTVAEGVETDLQANELVRLGCTHAQGYYFARPEPSEMMTARLGFDDKA
jgi:diguanylate cyclase (GGDEF)-like protein